MNRGQLKVGVRPAVLKLGLRIRVSLYKRLENEQKVSVKSSQTQRRQTCVCLCVTRSAQRLSRKLFRPQLSGVFCNNITFQPLFRDPKLLSQLKMNYRCTSPSEVTGSSLAARAYFIMRRSPLPPLPPNRPDAARPSWHTHANHISRLHTN